MPLTMDHSHGPLYRVVRQRCPDPLDISHSRRRFGDYRWNTSEFPALYCCCSEWVARAVALDRLRLAGVDLSDLQPGARPQLVEIEWSGVVINVASADGVAAAGYPRDYPEAVRKEQTRRSAAEWHSTGAEGVVYRSAVLQRRGYTHWAGSHQRWCELAIFVTNSQADPTLVRRRQDPGWLGG
jgi:hypothetical protein